jgi:hypothetical protein
MVFLVERYIPNLDREALLRRLEALDPATAELRRRGIFVRYLGSTIVVEDDACFCQFEAESEAAVREANRRAGMPCDRVVGAEAFGR